MVNLVAFETVEDLEKLTGLTNTELWNHDFDLDDWDIGFQSDTLLHKSYTDEWGYKQIQLDFDKPLWWLVEQMQNYCVGASYTEYDGKHYYLVHHS